MEGPEYNSTFCGLQAVDLTGLSAFSSGIEEECKMVPAYGMSFIYISSLYFAYATLTTVGYGDIKASTHSERGVALVALVVGSAVFAGIVGTMSQLMETMDEIEEMKLNKVKHIQQFMKSHHFPESLRYKIRNYYELHFQQMKKELLMLDELSPALRHECLHHIYFDLLKKIPFLKDSSQIVQTAVIANVNPILSCAKDYLVIEGQILDTIFMVASGAVEVINNRGIVCRTYGVGSFFGEKCAFYSNYLSTVSLSYRAKVDCELLSINRNDFVELLNTYSDFADQFVMICQKREDHKQLYKKSGGSGKMQKHAESMVRPCTPPVGKTWGDSRGQNPASKKKKSSSLEGNNIGVFDDGSVSGLLEKLQFNISEQLCDIQDHLEALEERMAFLDPDFEAKLEAAIEAGGAAEEGKQGSSNIDDEPLRNSTSEVEKSAKEGRDEEYSENRKSLEENPQLIAKIDSAVSMIAPLPRESNATLNTTRSPSLVKIAQRKLSIARLGEDGRRMSTAISSPRRGRGLGGRRVSNVGLSTRDLTNEVHEY